MNDVPDVQDPTNIAEVLNARARTMDAIRRQAVADFKAVFHKWRERLTVSGATPPELAIFDIISLEIIGTASLGKRTVGPYLAFGAFGRRIERDERIPVAERVAGFLRAEGIETEVTTGSSPGVPATAYYIELSHHW